ncbi:MAG: folate-binding protein YgfZ [Gammaproteobacteria bacterium]|jgi:folate-binding protein YgfZ
MNTLAAIEKDVALIDLSDVAYLRVSGPDHRAFLQAQLTSDIEMLGTHVVQPTAWLNPKGQVLTLMTLLGYEDHVDVLLPTWQCATILQRLRMFVLRSKVTIARLDDQASDPAGDAIGCIGLAGPTASTWFKEHVGFTAPEVRRITAQGDMSCASLPGSIPRLVLFAPRQKIAALVEQSGAAPADTAMWAIASVRAGVPTLHPQTSQRYIAQMLNLDLSGAVSFDKGCYPGQEIVARTQYLGKLKRRLSRGTTIGPPPDPLTAIHRGTTKVGEVVDSAPTASGGAIVLGMLGVDAATELKDSTLTIGEIGSPQDVKMTLSPSNFEGNGSDV